MAGNGPAPKDAQERRHRHKPARGDWIDLDPLEAVVLPDLPELFEESWRADTAATWKAWQEDPVTAMYGPADIAYALDTIRLHQAMTPSTANEVRLRMDALGLTPKGKKDLRWRLPNDPAALEEASKSAPANKGSKDRRKRLSESNLSVVK